MGGQTIQNIGQHGYLNNILSGLTHGKVEESRKRIGENVDPSCDTSPTNVINQGYCAALTEADATEDQFYSIRSWLGFFNGSTTVIDTGITGQIDIEITLAPASCLMFGSMHNINGDTRAQVVAAQAAYHALKISL